MNDEKILEYLKENEGGFTSGEDLSAAFKVTRSAIWKGIESLRKLGYEIQAQPHLGYKLTHIPDKLFAHEIRYQLNTRFLGQKIHSYDELDSTNNTAFLHAEKGAPEGACVFSEHQKKGKGRLGRTWDCPKGKGLLFSYVLRPRITPQEVSKITLVAAVSVIKACAKFTQKNLGIKWPNDIVFQEKKVGGILTEMSAESDRVNFVIVGIGLNINSLTSELPAGGISLREITKSPWLRVEFTKQLLRQIEEDYLRFKDGRFSEIAREWEEHSATSGRRVVATLLDRKIQGQATGIDQDGALWVRTDSGLQEKIMSGDIQHLR